MVAAPLALLPLVRGTSSEHRPGGSTELGSPLSAIATRLRIVALHSSSFPVVGGKSRSNCACQGLCWRRWQRNLHGSRRASTFDHVRRSSITTPRSHAVFTSTSASGQVFYVPGVALGALPAAMPEIFGVITPFVAHCLGGACC